MIWPLLAVSVLGLFAWTFLIRSVVRGRRPPKPPLTFEDGMEVCVGSDVATVHAPRWWQFWRRLHRKAFPKRYGKITTTDGQELVLRRS